MEIKEKVNEIFQKVKTDDGFAKKFAKDPIKTVEKTFNIDLPDEQIEKIVEGVKAKLKLEDGNSIRGKVNGMFDW